MKFRMVHLGYRQTPKYPYDCRIELIEYSLEEREQLGDWLMNNKIPHTTAGWNTGSVIYLNHHQDAVLFALKWAGQ